jgi:uncharacterized repeat protein (TIGR01451 family)
MFRCALLALLLVSLVASPATPVRARRPASELAQIPAEAIAEIPAEQRGAQQQASSLLNILDIPMAQSAPKIDGYCDDYLDGVSVDFMDGSHTLGTVYVQYVQSFLYVCMKAAPGTFPERFARLYLDPQADGFSYVFADQGDVALQLNLVQPGKSSYRGTGQPNGWTPDPSLDAFWTGAAVSDVAADSAEWAVDAGRFFIDPCRLFGMAVYHHWFAGVGDDYGMPSNQWFDQPATWQLSRMFSPVCTDVSGRIAYVFRGNLPEAVSFYNLLVEAGYSVTLVPLDEVLATDFSFFTLVIIADDTGSLDQWGTAGLTVDQVKKIQSENKPTIGLGEGGYAYFGRLAEFIGWPNGWHGPQHFFDNTGQVPAFFTGIGYDPVIAYAVPHNSVGIYLGAGSPADVTPVALEVPTRDHASLILQGCHLLWGNGGNPLEMTGDGRTVFLNGVAYMNGFQCPPPPPPPEPTCISVSKTAEPAASTPVAPGDVISYILTVIFSNDPRCENRTARLIDSVPLDTTFVPGSASDGNAPGPDGALVWTITPAPVPIIKTFKVVVSQNQCDGQRMVNNRAGLLVPGYDPVISNAVSHPVECPPVGFPNDQPSYAEDEIQIHPYPLVTGTASEIRVRVSNYSASPQTVNVAFQTDPGHFGIGLAFGTFDSQTLTIPAHGNVIVVTHYTPVTSGHYCIQVVVSGPGLAEPLVTQRNLDVSEDLQPGVEDQLVFPVRNPTAGFADITLVVDNTCPGWTASVNPAVLTNMSAGEVRIATLSVTPPNSAVLGTACHIDVQGWIGSQMIGGIRKLDVPPVNLPPDVSPPWEEPEISTNPDPLTAGQSGEACITLQNPLGTPRTVTVEFAEADFGAGVGFTKFGEEEVILPPHSLVKICVPYTPALGGTLHRCLLVTLKQAGFRDQHSQRNITLIRTGPQQLNLIDVPFVVGNSSLITQTLVVTTTVTGIDGYWMPRIFTDEGTPPPGTLGSRRFRRFHLQFAGGMPSSQTSTAAPAAPPPDYAYGDVSQAQVAIYLGGELLGGFTVELYTTRKYLPIIFKP